MKKILLLILTIFACCLQICLADNGGENQTNNTLKLTKIKGGQTSNRPHMPDRQVITCVYDGENICLDFAYSEGVCDTYVMDARTGEMQHFSFDSSELSVFIYVGEIGESYITLVTEYGNTYEGTILGDDPD